METVNEQSTCIINASFWDENKIPVVPTQAWYSLYCETTDTVIRVETEITGLMASKDIEVTPTENKIQIAANSSEIKALTVRYTYSVGKQGTGYYRYSVQNLRRIP